MNIYLIERLTRTGYDEYDSHVIAANDEETVLALAAGIAGDEGPLSWASEKVKIREIGTLSSGETEPFIILSSFNAG